jgi:hypothetical protein
MSILSPSDLETLDYGQPNWPHIMTSNFQKVNWRLQKVERLLDCDLHDRPAAPSFLRWDAAKAMWRPARCL